MAETAIKWPRLSILLLALVHSAASANDARLEDIRQCVQANLPQSSFSQKIALKSWDGGGGSRELSGQLFGERSSAERLSLMMRIDAPQDLQGARYLLNRRHAREDMFVYLPALGKTRRIAGGMRGQPLWGTDFSYEDIRHLQGAMGNSRLEYLGDERLLERDVYQLRMQQDEDSESLYSYLEFDIDQSSCVPLQVRFFDNAGEVKTMQIVVDKIHQMDGRWVIGEVEMLDHRSHTRSSLSLSKYVFDPDLSRNLFHPKSFHLAN